MAICESDHKHRNDSSAGNRHPTPLLSAGRLDDLMFGDYIYFSPLLYRRSAGETRRLCRTLSKFVEWPGGVPARPGKGPPWRYLKGLNPPYNKGADPVLSGPHHNRSPPIRGGGHDHSRRGARSVSPSLPQIRAPPGFDALRTCSSVRTTSTWWKTPTAITASWLAGSTGHGPPHRPAEAAPAAGRPRALSGARPSWVWIRRYRCSAHRAQ